MGPTMKEKWLVIEVVPQQIKKIKCSMRKFNSQIQKQHYNTRGVWQIQFQHKI